MLKRSARASFFPDAWVFPGGRVDASDARTPVSGTVPNLPDTLQASAVAALRECFEEAGIWLGQGAPSVQLRDGLNNRTANLVDDGPDDLCADLHRLVWWAWWVTPVEEPRRYDTQFFLSLVHSEEVQDACPDQTETVSHLWIRPSDAVQRADQGRFFLAPPTLRTLEELATFGSSQEAFAAGQSRVVHPICPRVDASEVDGLEGWAIILPGHVSYPSEHPVTPPHRLVFRGGKWNREP